MEFKGTQGNWNLLPSLSKPAYNVIGTQLGGKFKIARCPYFVNPYSEELTFKDEQESKYNALLISKAPEMLEMLKESMRVLRNVQSPATPSLILYNEIEQLIKQATEL